MCRERRQQDDLRSVWKTRDGEETMSQSEQILTALKKGDRITPMDALTRFQCFRLSARILELKDDGHQIDKTTVKKGKKSYAEYYYVMKEDV
jgi:hypothetical protein